MVPVWFAAFCAGWAVCSTALALLHARRERQAQATMRAALRMASDAVAQKAALESSLPLMVMVRPDGVVDATMQIDQACYWLN